MIALLAFVSVGFGLMAKFSPQMNVMIVAFPLKIVAGLLLFGLTLQIIAIATQNYISEFKQYPSRLTKFTCPRPKPDAKFL